VSQKTLTGSCLCGGVEYAVTGELQRFYHCHCSRCRKSSGTGHASNLVVKAGAVDWTRGKDLLGVWKVPEAERFYNQFCTRCGSPLPRVVPQLGMVVVPAGSLDVDPGMQPQARIFWQSRSDWSCARDGLPVFDAYP